MWKYLKSERDNTPGWLWLLLEAVMFLGACFSRRCELRGTGPELTISAENRRR